MSSEFIKGLMGIFFLGYLLLFAVPLHATQLQPNRGPVLHYSDGQLQVRVQGKFKNPILQWRFEGKQKEFSMKQDDRNYWEAHLEDLQGEYRLVDGKGSTPWIPILHQRPKSNKFKFVAYGGNLTGQGHSPTHKNLIKKMKKEKPSLVIHTGGLVAQGGMPRFWDQFFREVQPLVQSVPFQPVLGTTDRSKTGRFVDHTDIGDREETRYQFHFGGAHFIALDTTRNFSPGGAQYQYLKESLEKLKGQSPIIVYFYHPPFSSSAKGGDQKVLKHLVPLFEDYGVDLVLTGQDHAYQRIGPINGVTYIGTGGGGAMPSNITPHPNLENYKLVYHYLVFEVDGGKIYGKVKGLRGVVEDSFQIDHLQNPVPEDQRRAHPKMNPSRRYKYATPY